MTDFLLELRSEEIPARMQVKAKDDLARLFAQEIAKAGLIATAIETFATPRRLALIARGLPDATEAVREETKGPKAAAPPQALEGFLRKTGLTRDQLVERDGVLFAVIDKPGRETGEVLAAAIAAVVRAFQWPKSMRWGGASASTESLRWVRPLQGIVALFGEEVVPVEIDGIAASATTYGHRFHHPGAITIGGAHDYVEKLRACHVIVHLSERVAIIRDGARAAAAAEGLVLVEDEALVVENAGLTEWPVPLLGRFDAAFLGVPPEVIRLTMRTNQKYFACVTPGDPAVGPELVEGRVTGGDASSEAPFDKLRANGVLSNAFVCTANIVASDGGAAVVAGNERVLSARLADAKFFWENDLKVPLDVQREKLKDIVFHEKLGTVADKVERVAKLARWLCEEGIVFERQREAPSSVSETQSAENSRSARTGSSLTLEQEELATLAERAAHLCKADLVTGMVGEFPELQGIIGGHLARAQGEDPRVADAIRDHYKPVGQGDDVPTAPVTVAVSLADKLDTIVSFSAIGEMPTGSRDPFALRRAALGAIRTILENDLRVHIYGLCRGPGEQLLSQTFWRLSESASIWSELKHTGLFQGGLTLNDEYAVALVEMHDGDHIEEKIMLPDEVPDLLVLAADLSHNLVPRNKALRDFFFERLKVQQRQAGVRHDLIDAVSSQGDDLVRLLARVRALQAFVGTEDGAKLLGGYKRAANILKKEISDTRHPGPRAGVPLSSDEQARSGTPDQVRGDGEVLPAEAALTAALDAAEPLAADAIAREDFEAAMTALATLREPIDFFFEHVTVNDPEPAKRAARLALLERVRNAVHTVADFSKIEG